MAKFGKTYPSKDEYETRKQVFAETHAEIEKINSRNDNTFVCDHNFMSDWTRDEYKRLLGTWDQTTKPNKLTALVEEWYNTDDLAEEIDWVKSGAVTPVKN